MRKLQHGYSLIEVLVAIAITAVVLLTVVTMFYMGRRNVYSGKQMTVANSVGTRILEDLSTMTAQDLQTHFNLTDNTGLVTVTLPTVSGFGAMTFPTSIARDTSACSPSSSPLCPAAVDPDGFLAAWYKMIVPGTDVSATLANPTIGLVITPRLPTNINPATGAACTCPVTTAQFLKIRAYVAWDDATKRRRYAFFDTTRVARQ